MFGGSRLRLCTPLPRSSPSCRSSRSSSRSHSPSPRWPCWSRPYGACWASSAAASRHPAAATTRPVARSRCSRRRSLHTRMLQWTWVGIMHWFVYAAFLFLQHRCPGGVLPALRARLRLPLDRPLVPVRVGQRADRPARPVGIVFADRLPAEAPPARRRADAAASSARPCGRATSSRRWRCSRARRSSSSARAEYDARRGRRRAAARTTRFSSGSATLFYGLSSVVAGEPHLPHRDVQDRIWR